MIVNEDYRNYDLIHATMRTDKLSAEEIGDLVVEAYSYLYTSSRSWSRAKQYLNPFGPYGWLFRRLHRIIPAYVCKGLTMARRGGIPWHGYSDELKNTKLPAELVD
jgi:hypothetical protein